MQQEFSLESVRQYIYEAKGRSVTTSKDVALVFGRRHSNVLRDIDELIIPDDFRELNFEPVEIIEKSASNAPVRRKWYEITRDGIMFLVMGYQGEKASKMKLAYMLAFNAMEEELRKRPSIAESYTLGMQRGINFAGMLADNDIKKADLARLVWLRRIGLSQKDAAALIGVNKDRVRTIERGLADMGIPMPEAMHAQTRHRHCLEELDALLRTAAEETDAIGANSRTPLQITDAEVCDAA